MYFFPSPALPYGSRLLLILSCLPWPWLKVALIGILFTLKGQGGSADKLLYAWDYGEDYGQWLVKIKLMRKLAFGREKVYTQPELTLAVSLAKNGVAMEIQSNLA